MLVCNRVNFAFLITVVVFICFGKCQEAAEDEERKKEMHKSLMIREAAEAAQYTFYIFVQMTDQCLSRVTKYEFIRDTLQMKVQRPMKTTIGVGPKYTLNRKFIANLISSTAFKKMLTRDQNHLKEGLANRLKFCEEAILDSKILKDMYERDVEESRL